MENWSDDKENDHERTLEIVKPVQQRLAEKSALVNRLLKLTVLLWQKGGTAKVTMK